MNVHHVKSVIKYGLQSWLNDKKSIFLRLVLWPNLIPIGLIGFMALSLAVMSLRISGGGESNQIKTSFTVYGTGFQDEIASVLTNKPLAYKYLEVSSDKNNDDYVKNLIRDKKVTFAIKVTTTNSGSTIINIVYDREREYIHKSWVDKVKGASTQLALSIRKSKFSSYGLTEEQLTNNLSPILLKENPFGQTSGSYGMAILVFFLWGVFLVLPLNATSFITTNQMLSDTREDFLPIWKAAGVKSSSMLMGRFITSWCVYLIGLIVMFLTLSFWVMVYSYFVDKVGPFLAQNTVKKEEIYGLTYGFQKLLSSIGVYEILTLLFITALTAGLVILLKFRLSIYFSNMEQVRTKAQPLELLIANLPFIGLMTGTFTMSLYLSLIPFISNLMALQYLFKSGIPGEHVALSTFSLITLMCVLFYSITRLIGDQNRVINQY